jgi:hypothetical protein
MDRKKILHFFVEMAGALFFYSFVIIAGGFILTRACNSDDSEKENIKVGSVESFATYLNSKTFYRQALSSESETYSFDGKLFTLRLKNKRSGAVRTQKGSYTVESSKFEDNGKVFYYAKLLFDYGGTIYLVYKDNSLVRPAWKAFEYSDVGEDEYGLVIDEYYVNRLPDEFYWPVEK